MSLYLQDRVFDVKHFPESHTAYSYFLLVKQIRYYCNFNFFNKAVLGVCSAFV